MRAAGRGLCCGVGVEGWGVRSEQRCRNARPPLPALPARGEGSRRDWELPIAKNQCKRNPPPSRGRGREGGRRRFGAAVGQKRATSAWTRGGAPGEETSGQRVHPPKATAAHPTTLTFLWGRRSPSWGRGLEVAADLVEREGGRLDVAPPVRPAAPSPRRAACRSPAPGAPPRPRRAASGRRSATLEFATSLAWPRADQHSSARCGIIGASAGRASRAPRAGWRRAARWARTAPWAARPAR